MAPSRQFVQILMPIDTIDNVLSERTIDVSVLSLNLNAVEPVHSLQVYLNKLLAVFAMPSLIGPDRQL